MIWFVFGSTPVSLFDSGVVTHTAPSPYVTPAEFGGTVTSAVPVFFTGSIFERTPFPSVTSHTACGLAAIPPSLADGPIGTVATTWFVLVSIRETVLSAQLGTHTLPKPAASPE